MRQSVRLDDEGRALGADVVAGGAKLLCSEAAKARGWNSMPCAEFLHEGLRTFQPRRGQTRTKGGYAGSLEPVHEAQDQGLLWPDPHEVDWLRLRQRDQSIEIRRRHRSARNLRDPGIA